MKIWSAEIKELERLYESFKGQHPKLDKELEKLVKTDDENMVLIYARRCLEVIITDLSQRELKRPRGTEPLKGIIDKLNKEEKVPNNIIVSMQNLNSLSTFGAHPKDFDPRQVKPVILDLTTVLEWYLTYMESQVAIEKEPGALQVKRKEQVSFRKTRTKPWKRIIAVVGILLAGAIIIVSLIVFDIIGGGKQARAESIGSIVVLPFSDYTGQDTLEWFVSGMHSALIQDMGKIGSLRIPGTTTSQVFKNSDKTINEITSELKVGAALETAVLCLGDDSICFQTRLIKTGQEEEQLWIADYKIARNQILNWYNGVTKQIAEEVKVELTGKEETLLADARTVNKDAYDNYLKGKFYWERLGKEDLEKALEYFNHAIELDPGWAPPYAGVAEVYGGLMQMGFMPPGEAMPKINENLDKAIELDPDYPGSHYSKAIFGVWMEWDWEKGEREFLKALEINPNDVMSRIYYSHLLWILKRYDEGYFHSQMAVELDPMNPLVLALSAMVDEQGRTPQALEKCKKALEIDPEHYFALLAYAEATYFNGDYKNSIETELKTWQGLDDEARKDIMAVFQDKGYVEAIRTMLTYVEEYAKTNYIGYFEMGEYYWKAGNLDKSIECYIKAYEMHDPMMPYITLSEIGFDDIKDDPRIIAIIEKMNLPFTAPN